MTYLKRVFGDFLQRLCSDATSKHASQKFDFKPEAISLLVFRLPFDISHMMLTADRTVYLTAKVMKKIHKLIVPEDLQSALVALVF